MIDITQIYRVGKVVRNRIGYLAVFTFNLDFTWTASGTQGYPQITALCQLAEIANSVPGTFSAT